MGITRALEWGAEFVLLVNQDTIVTPELIGRLAACAEEPPRAGVIGAKTISTQPMPDGAPRVLYLGAWQGRLPLAQRVPGTGLLDRGGTVNPFQVDYVCGQILVSGFHLWQK
jgi:hypothetical protein